MTHSRAEQEFHREMVVGAQRLQREIGYNPTRFRQMVDEHRGVGAVRLLLRGRDASDGFTTLWENGRLDMSCEVIALLPWYADLFTNDERDVAHRRLGAHGFDIEGFLQEGSLTSPSWYENAGE
jgi:hypothetical protein